MFSDPGQQRQGRAAGQAGVRVGPSGVVAVAAQTAWKPTYRRKPRG